MRMCSAGSWTGLDDEFSTLKFLGQELQMRAQSIRFQKAA